MPYSSQLHQNKPLENISIRYTPQGMIADELSPRFMVKKESDQYYVYSKDNLRLAETLRADGAESNKDSYTLSTASYVLAEHTLHDDVTDRQKANADTAVRPEIDVTETLTDKILLRREKDLADKLQTSGAFSNAMSLSSTYAWSANTTLSNPITQIDTIATTVLNTSGKDPNIVSMNKISFNAAKEHVSIVDRIKYTSADSVGEALLAKLFNVDKVLVGKATYNSAEEGLSDDLSTIWTDTTIVAWVDKTPGLRKVSAFYTYWNNSFGAPFKVKKWREEKLAADRVEVGSMFQNLIISSDCAGVIVNCVQ